MQTKLVKPLTNFEELEKKYFKIVTSNDFASLIELFKKHKDIYVIGNGGLHYVASHMATDISRLVPDKYCHSFDSFGFITSSANDFGFDSIFKRWIETCVNPNSPSLILGMSCSGKSKNIINAFNYVENLGWDTFMIAGRPTDLKYPKITIDAYHYHTVEAICLMLFYEIIHALGHECPALD